MIPFIEHFRWRKFSIEIIELVTITVEIFAVQWILDACIHFQFSVDFIGDHKSHAIDAKHLYDEQGIGNTEN